MVKLDLTPEKVIISTLVAGATMAGTPIATEANTEHSSKENTLPTSNELLQIGHEGKDVYSLQMKLAEKNYFHDKQDGVYGPITEFSIREFQKDQQLTIDGIAGPETLSALYSPSEKSKSKSSSEQTFIQDGDEGPMVKRIQQQLKEAGFYFSTVDGKFGSLTEKAVVQYQQTYGLMIDGIVGPKTMEHLSGVKVKTTNALKNKSAKVYSPSPHSNSSPMILNQTDKESDHKDEEHSNITDADLISSAESLLGTPYQWGGTTPNGFDCSGFLRYVFKKTGSQIPRTVSEIWAHATSTKTLQPGDLVFFETYKTGPSHAGIYIGEDQFIHASSSKGVTTSSLDMNYWSSRYLGAKTISN